MDFSPLWFTAERVERAEHLPAPQCPSPERAGRVGETLTRELQSGGGRGEWSEWSEWSKWSEWSEGAYERCKRMSVRACECESVRV